MTECFLVYDHYDLNDHDLMVLACFRKSDRRLLYIKYNNTDNNSLVGNIYAARVEKNVPGVGTFFTGSDNVRIFVREKDCHDPFYIRRQSPVKELCAGDLILVQIIKDAIKTKEPLGSLVISIKTPDFLIRRPGSGVNLSRKLSGEQREEFKSLSAEGCSILIRTAAAHRTLQELSNEIKTAGDKLSTVFSDGKNHSSPSLIWRNDDLLNNLLCAFPFASNDLSVTEIKTSDPDICRKLGSYGSLYKDDGLSLLDLYRIRTITDTLRQKKVWLKNGSNIVIEQTEALVSIDVNSAKSKGKDVYEINREAAISIMEQLRLRNLSGIIIIDFMKMHSDNEKNDIIHLMRKLASMDPARIGIEDFTNLGLLEMTREKKSPSISEVIGG